MGLTVAVMADLHIYNPATLAGATPSHIALGASPGPLYDPLEGLFKLVEGGLRADLLLCCGDISDRASPDALRFGWGRLQDLAGALGARLIATAGNHDIDSQHLHGLDPLDGLQALAPPFPSSAPNVSDRYWAKHYAIQNLDGARIVTLDSSVHDKLDEERSRGLVTARTVDSLLGDLAAEAPSRVQVLLCHHHPHRYGDIDLSDYSEMAGGSHLLDVLGRGDLGHWLVIHGHKHYARLSYAFGGAHSPVILSAGSCSAVLYPEAQTRYGNQFYVLSFDPEAADSIGSGIAGRYRAWDWGAAVGWRPASPSRSMPAEGGFGYRVNLPGLAQRVAEFIRSTGNEYVSWPSLIAHIPELLYILPCDLKALAEGGVSELCFLYDSKKQTLSQVGLR